MGSITAEQDLISDQGNLLLPTATGGAGGEIQAENINLINGAGAGNDSVLVGSGDVRLNNGNLVVDGSVPGPGNGDLNVQGEITAGGAVVTGTALTGISMSAALPANIAPGGVSSFSILDVGAGATTAEVTVVLFGSSEVVS